MKQTIIKLVDAILQRLEESPETPPTESGLRTWLVQQGFNKRDIDDALKLVRPRVGPKPQPGEVRPLALRTFSEIEAYKLTPEARDALLRLERFGLIDGFEREMVLDRLNTFETEIGIEELDYLVSWLVCSTRDHETQRTVFQVFEGAEKKTYH